jgi:hypothetical protein
MPHQRQSLKYSKSKWSKPRTWSNLEAGPSSQLGNLEMITENARRNHGDPGKITKDPRRHHDKYPLAPALARQQTAEMVAVIMTKFPLVPALARQQTAEMVAIIMTKFLLVPALARQQTAEMVAVITTKFPLAPALARQQMAKMVLATGPHLGGLGNDCGGSAYSSARMRKSMKSAAKLTNRQKSGPRT